MTDSKQNRPPFFIIAILAVLGVLLILLLTRWGIGVSPDSVSYIGGARSLIKGDGLVNGYGEDVGEPMTFRAPLYSILLTAVSISGLDPLAGARWLNAFIFGANILLVGFLIYSVTRHLNWLPVLGCLLVLSSLVMLNIHAFAWTEPLFILLGFSGFLLLSVYLQNQKYGLLILSALLMGLAVLTRYAGLPLVATGALGLLLFAKGSYGRRLLDAVLYGLVGILPFALWTVRNTFVTGNSAGRDLAFHPLGMNHIWQAVYTITGWLQVPDFVPGIVRLLLIVVVAGGLLFLIYWAYSSGKVEDSADTAVPDLIKLLLLFILIYLAFLVVSISFLDANTPLDDRILSPVFVAGVVLAAYAIAVLWQRTRRKTLLAGLVMVGMALFLVTAVFKDGRWGLRTFNEGLGFSGKAWQSSEILAQIKQLPDGTPIYSNVPEAIYLHTNQPALSFPRPYNVTTQQPDPAYPEKIAEMEQQMSQNDGVIVFFDTLRPEAQEIVDEVASQLPLSVLVKSFDGTIYHAESN